MRSGSAHRCASVRTCMPLERQAAPRQSIPCAQGDGEGRADDVDAVNVLRGGTVREGEFENGSWRHRVETQRMVFVVTFDPEPRADGVAASQEVIRSIRNHDSPRTSRALSSRPSLRARRDPIVKGARPMLASAKPTSRKGSSSTRPPRSAAPSCRGGSQTRTGARRMDPARPSRKPRTRPRTRRPCTCPHTPSAEHRPMTSTNRSPAPDIETDR